MDHEYPIEEILQPGRNCWRIEQSGRMAVLIDSDAYFAALRAACGQARDSIFLLGWDFDRRERLGRDEDAPTIESFLFDLLDAQPGLHIYLLLWDFHFVYATEREWFQAWKLKFNRHERLHVRFDGNHPAGASHHQKIVAIDDVAAFCGGIDLSRWRWDTPEHRADDARRVDPDGKHYPPFHDAMVLVEGAAAAALGEIACDRWRRSGSPEEARPARASGGEIWPEDLDPLLRDIDIAIARTLPAHHEQAEVREVEALFLDAVKAARDYIYLENQYFTSAAISECLAARLKSETAPEVVLVLPRKTGGWLEQVTMDAIRSFRLRHLLAADHHDKLRVFYPDQPGLSENECINVHSKLMIVDDRFLHLGSANTSDRSMGLDSECDLALTTSETDRLAWLLHRLLAEHLDDTIESVREAREESGSLIGAIDKLRRPEGRSLYELKSSQEATEHHLEGESDLVDPSEPIDSGYLVRRVIDSESALHGHRRLYLFIGLVAILLLLAGAWRWTPLADWLATGQIASWLSLFDRPSVRSLTVVAVIVLASLLMVPLSVLVVASAIVLGPWLGFACGMAAALLSAWLAFLAGNALGGRIIERFSGSQIHTLSQRLSERGIMAVAMVRLIPVAPYTVVNLVAGASHLSAGKFMLGSLIGLVPGLAGLSLFSGSLYQAVVNPGPDSLALLAVIAAVVAVGALVLRRLLRKVDRDD